MLIAAHVALPIVHLAHRRIADEGPLGLVALLVLSYAAFASVLPFFRSGRATLREALDLIQQAAAKFRIGKAQPPDSLL